jgi:uncharacterized protein YegP (UPF0339 family)
MPKTPTLEVYKDKKGGYRFRLVSKNGEPVVASESYASKSTAMSSAKKLRDWVHAAPIVDKDAKTEVAKKTTGSVSKKTTSKKMPKA